MAASPGNTEMIFSFSFLFACHSVVGGKGKLPLGRVLKPAPCMMHMAFAVWNHAQLTLPQGSLRIRGLKGTSYSGQSCDPVVRLSHTHSLSLAGNQFRFRSFGTLRHVDSQLWFSARL